MYEAPSNPVQTDASARVVRLPDFDELLRLASEEPDSLERLREELCNRVIAGAPPAMQARLKGLQFRIDAERRLSQHPMGACIRISRLMNESLAELQHALNDPSAYVRQKRRQQGKVVPLFKTTRQ
ncbi:MAG: DUF3135 domain-containing protein [Oleiphilaceae bacterium]|nr:DUF3135 domain-containing protein [Oleiphilaceae bacterium]